MTLSIDHIDQAPLGSSFRARTLLQVLWRRKSLVVLGAVLGLLISAIVYSQQAAVFESSTQLLVIKKRSENVMPVSGGNGFSFGEDFVATHVFVLRSPVIIERAVKKHDLGSLKSCENCLDPVAAIGAGLLVGRVKDKDSSTAPSNILSLSFRGPCSDDCPRILNSIIDAYQEFLEYNYTTSTAETVTLINKARDVLKVDKLEADEKLRTFLRNSPLLWRTREGGNLYQERIGRIEKERSQLMVRKAELESKLQGVVVALNKKQERGILGIALAYEKNASGGMTREESLLPLLLEEQQLLNEGFGEDHYKVKAIRQRIAFVRDFQKKGDGREPEMEAVKPASGKKDQPVLLLNPIERYQYLLSYELQEVCELYQKLGVMAEKLKEDARDLISQELEEVQLRNQVAQLERLHDVTVKRLAEINIIKDAGGFDSRVLSKPGPGAQIAPKLMKSSWLGLLIGAMAGVGLAYLSEMADRGFRSSDDIRSSLGLPIVGHIPLIKGDAEAIERAQDDASMLDPLLVVHHRSMSVEAEASRAVRTALYFGTQDKGHRLIQITSPCKGDGKTLVLANLAVSIAQAKKRVIIVDADCRRPRQHKVFGLSAAAGLVNVIAGEANLQSTIQQTCVAGLDVLPAGPLRPNPAELLTSPVFKGILDSLRNRYDFVLIDTPPVLAVTDPCVVASLVDGVFLVVRLARDARPKGERAREILANLGVKMFGVIVNGVPRKDGSGLYAEERYEYTENYREDAGNYYDVSPEAFQRPSETKDRVQAQGNEATGEPPLRGGLFSWLLRWWV